MVARSFGVHPLIGASRYPTEGTRHGASDFSSVKCLPRTSLAPCLYVHHRPLPSRLTCLCFQALCALIVKPAGPQRLLAEVGIHALGVVSRKLRLGQKAPHSPQIDVLIHLPESTPRSILSSPCPARGETLGSRGGRVTNTDAISKVKKYRVTTPFSTAIQNGQVKAPYRRPTGRVFSRQSIVRATMHRLWREDEACMRQTRALGVCIV